MSGQRIERVVVAGAGPVGLVAALLLADRGVEVVVLEATGREVQPEWRGSTIHPPTLEILDEIGLADAAIDGGIVVDQLVYGDLELPEVVSFDYGLIADDTRFPRRMQFEQYKLLRLLRDRAVEHPKIDVRWHQTVTGCSDDGEQVVVELTASAGAGAGNGAGAGPGDGDRPASVAGDVLIAADGSHSAVRRAVGISMPGDTYPTMSLVAATDYDIAATGRTDQPVAYYSGPLGRASFIRTPDVWRVAVTTEIPSDDSMRTVASLDDDATVHPNLRTALDLYTGSDDWQQVAFRQHQTYRSHQRVADRFHVGRVVLVGDAAHLASTAGGMGLNSGVHDAYDLAERLCSASSIDAAIAEYDSVRREVSLDVVQRSTTAARTAVDHTAIGPRRERLERLAALAADEVTAREHLRTASMLDAVPIRPGRPSGLERQDATR